MYVFLSLLTWQSDKAEQLIGDSQMLDTYEH